MTLRVDAIKFNYDPSGAANDALTIRRNATQTVAVPEWVRGVSTRPEDSPAAYSVADTLGNTLSIQVQFECTTSKAGEMLEIRAVDDTVDPPLPPGCQRGCSPFWRLLVALIRNLFGNVLGEALPTQVQCHGGTTGWVSFELANTRIDKVGVGVHITTWRWQYRHTPSAPWTDFDTTSHRIYVLLGTPTLPWGQMLPDATQLPWTDVLDYACPWALGTQDRVAAAAAVTSHVYGLGPGLIEYDCPGGGSTHYANAGLDCSAFLDRLRGGPGNGQYVNCTDCATITSTFANALGCDLSQGLIGYDFLLNPIRAIGRSAWYPGCPGWLTPGFDYHEVAWEGAGTATDRVWDACLEVDGDDDPTSDPHTPLLPTNMVFGTPGSGDYRDRLATPDSRSLCEPQGAGIRRPVR